MHASPAVFGIAEAALAPVAEVTAAPLRAGLAEVRDRVYALADAPVPQEHRAERPAPRIRACEVPAAATTAAVAGGSRSLALASKARRLAHEGVFLLVEGQTPESRRAHLESLGGS